MLHQVIQSVGQFLAIFITGMLVYKGWDDVVKVGILNAVYQPALQGVLGSLGIYGISKIKIGAGNP